MEPSFGPLDSGTGERDDDSPTYLNSSKEVVLH